METAKASYFSRDLRGPQGLWAGLGMGHICGSETGDNRTHKGSIAVPRNLGGCGNMGRAQVSPQGVGSKAQGCVLHNVPIGLSFKVSDGKVPDEKVIDKKVLYRKVLDGKLPDGKDLDGKVPDEKFLEGKYLDEKVFDRPTPPLPDSPALLAVFSGAWSPLATRSIVPLFLGGDFLCQSHGSGKIPSLYHQRLSLFLSHCPDTKPSSSQASKGHLWGRRGGQKAGHKHQTKCPAPFVFLYLCLLLRPGWSLKELIS